MNKKRLLFLLALFWLSWHVTAVAESFVVKDIEIEGLQRISPGTVFTYLPVAVGDEFDDSGSTKLLRNIYRTGFFEDAEVRRRGDVLVILVKERPAISDIRFDGAKDDTEELLRTALKDIGIASGRTFNPSVLERTEIEIRQQFYAQGKYNAHVGIDVEQLPRNRVDILITISEGVNATIRRVAIIGNEAFDDEKLLDRLESGTSGGLFSSRDEYQRPKLSGDIRRLRDYYLDRGYLKFNVDSTQVAISPDKKDIFITMNVTEGDQYKLKSIKVAGELVRPEQELMDLVDIKPGDVFSRSKITQATRDISQLLGSDGYAFANVNVVPDVNEETKEVDVTLFVDPGRRVYVRRINFYGNLKTHDEALRREMRQMEAAWYNAKHIERSKTRLQRLRFIGFANVRVNRVPGHDDLVDLDVTVEERSSGSFNAGAGFSQSQGVIFNADVTFDNFGGKGEYLKLGVNNSEVNTLYSVVYTDPYHTIDGVSRSYSASFRQTDVSSLDITSYSSDRYGMSIGTGVPLSEFDRFNYTVGVSQLDLTVGSDPPDEVSDFVDENGESYTSLELSSTYTHDTRNKTIFPTDGGITRLTGELNLPGSDLTFFKVKLRSQQFFEISDQTSFSVLADVAHGDGYDETDDVPFYEKFYAGGIRSVRGYADNTLGPLDSNGDPIGGNFRVLLNSELTFPFPGSEDNSNFRLSTFLDVGNVYENIDAYDPEQLKASVGIGAQWFSPIGPLVFSFASPVNPADGDDTQSFQFTIGGVF